MKKTHYLLAVLSLLMFCLSINIKANSFIADLADNMEIKETLDGIELLLPSDYVDVSNLSREQLDFLHQKGIEKFLAKKINTTSIKNNNLVLKGRPTHKVEHGKSVRRVFSGFAGNQPAEGNRFATGGGFYFSDNGGPSVTLNISFPSPFNTLSASVNLGNSSSSGKFVLVPDTIHYFKLFVEKTYDCRPFIVWAIDSNGNKTRYATDISKIHISTNQYAKRV